MARTKAADKSKGVSADYPQGLHTVTWTDLHEDEWWLITNLFRGRIDYFQQQLNEIIRSEDPDLIDNQTEWYQDTIKCLTKRLTEFENQISPVYFRRKRAEKAARIRSLTKACWELIAITKQRAGSH